ncbi:Asp-tRNA(Asn)/Glu-tRNA(Gln) amidotransferase subunit GatA [Candidatus Contubernalis alkaliaceticus]|uniref:Asp-tRNA(Asn)/Glu-tRNA(Gln) amidotransferase subunit GatA n=1 Tax=Candidatus Contubernalis alkaliaceticus TaxID=338645 RepID=UPI001F4BD8B2|nr:Asp-tRNA(Asn)/Glu-tRNA(Gln) amidotransferase subunit GatA [Candidatus Contubernalis alkalaceticus]UNC91521.1 Asp-tRNA(Asn)/Glu-tRNA(Gln) amidotransferase subunit GatA [Candidatus Contubernalis alkalaceticus]
MNLYELKVHEAHDLIKQKKISCEEILLGVLDRIEEVEGIVQGFVTVTRDYALKKARETDKKIALGRKVGPLTGIPFALKDNMCSKDILTTCSSKILEGFKPPYNATVFERLEEQGAVLVGKTNMDEFAMGSSTENSGLFATKNPWDPSRVPGGSSGGSAAVVASDQVPFALGSDTGGSIRQPASYCGVVGMKPTYGRVSRYGLVAFASSLDQIGPLTKDVKDCALVMNAICGSDLKDSTSAPVDVPDFCSFIGKEVKGIRMGIAEEYFSLGIDDAVRNVIGKAIDNLENLGMGKVELSLPHTSYALPAYYLVSPAEASSNLSRYDGIRYGFRHEDSNNLLETYQKTRSRGFGAEVKRRIMLGTYALSSGYYDAYYLKAQKVRTLIKNDFDEAFKNCDVIVTPTAPTVSFKAGENTQDPLQMYLNDVFTIPVSMSGLPAVSIPCGFINGLPVGLQIIGKPFDEGTILQVADAFEQSRSFLNMKPNFGSFVRGGV